MRNFTMILVLALSCRSSDKFTLDSQGVDSDSGRSETASPVDADEDGFPEGEDCDDADASIHPGALDDTCDGVDQNCDGTVDDGAPWETWYTDADGDGFGDEQSTVETCSGAPTGTVGEQVEGFDCNDSSADFYPGAPETDCNNPNDYNCDGSVAFADNDGDHYPACQDCDDDNAAAHPGGTEVCDGADNDCDGETDEGVQIPFYADTDQDGYGDETAVVEGCEAPSGFVAEQADGFDCDDASADYYPGAPETDCTDPNDYNCDGSVAYADQDADGWSACMECDDADPAVRPDATEVCNGIDDNCDGAIDDADAALDLLTRSTWYTDADGDGHGDAASSTEACAQPPATSALNDDCNDSDAGVSPSATEACDASDVDEDCDLLADDDDPEGATGKTLTFPDADVDGYGDSSDPGTEYCDPPSGVVTDNTDCDDGNSGRNPGLPEVCDAADLDEDCDGLADDDDPEGATGKTLVWPDADSDGYGDSSNSGTSYCDPPSGTVTDHTDCDDGNSSRNPGLPEVCDAADLDEDCDSLGDDLDPGGALGKILTYQDGDGDGYGASIDLGVEYCDPPSDVVTDNTDCDDSTADRNPGQPEVCDISDVDEDCDGLADDDDPEGATGKTVMYPDADSDSYGDSSDAGTSYCDPPSGVVTDNTDCDDSTAVRNPGQSEVCDANDVDEDCDLQADDADPEGATGKAVYYTDSDADTYGDQNDAGTEYCDPPSNVVTDNTDCDDSTAVRNPGQSEVCDANGVDEDCDGQANDDDPQGANNTTTWYQDNDNDGYGTSTTTERCDSQAGWASGDGDCNDSNNLVNPGATESCDGLDNDCDNTADESGCPCNVRYRNDNLHPYMFCTSNRNWNSARSYCQSYGYDLVSVANGSENSWADNTADSFSTGKWHIGFTDQWSEGTWVWSDGSSVTYTNWHSGEPNGGTGESCAQLNRFHPSTTWNDEPCGQSLPFVCEYN